MLTKKEPQVAQAHYDIIILSLLSIHTATIYKTLYENDPISS